MTEDGIKKKILQFVTLLTSDMDAAAEMMADGFAWENFLPDNVPFGGRYEGVAGMSRYFDQLANSWEIGELDIVEVIVSDDGRRCAAIGVETNGKALSTGTRRDIAFVWIFKTDEDGRFTYVREYNDTHAMYQAFV